MIFLMQECEEKLGYVFNDKSLLRQCFTHSSFSHENKNVKNNERLEFLGDSILGFVVADFIYGKDKGFNEGKLTDVKKSLVSTKPLSEAIEKSGLGEFILYGNGEIVNHNGSYEKTYENLFEAIVAGIYLDGGLEEAKKFIDKFLLKKRVSEKSGKAVAVKPQTDPKSELQERFQKKHLGTPVYKLIEKSGPDHEPIFRIAVYQGENKLAEGTGRSKHIAEKECARLALMKLPKKGENK